MSSLEDRVALPALLDPYNQAQLGLALTDALRACGYPDTLSCLLRRRGRGSMTVVGHRASAQWFSAAPVGLYAFVNPFCRRNFVQTEKLKTK